MDSSLYGTNAQFGAAASNYAGNMSNAAGAASQSASEAITLRLSALSSHYRTIAENASAIADKIVGSAPTPISAEAKNLQQPPAFCFLDSLQHLVGDCERAAEEAAEHLARLNRSF